MQVRTILLAAFLCIVAVSAGAAPGDVAAVVDGRTITIDEVDAPVESRLAELERQVYAIRRASLDNLIVRAVLEREAARQKIPVEALKEQLSSGSVAVSAEDVDRRYREVAGAFESVPLDEARERLRLDMQTQARLKLYRDRIEQLRRSTAIEIRLQDPHAVATIPDGDSPTRGAADAPISVVVFSDFECPYCRSALPLLEQIADTNPDVKLVYKYFPLSNHPAAFSAARAAHCARQQNAFWEFHDALLGTNDISSAGLRKAASGVGLEPARFEQCVASEASGDAVRAHLELGKKAGVSATPTIFINGVMVAGAVTLDSIQTAIARNRETVQGSIDTGR